MLRAQLNKPWKTEKQAHAGCSGASSRALGAAVGAGRQAEGHRSKVGEEVVDDVPILGAAKRPPELQVSTHFKDGVSSTSKGDLLNDKLITNGRERPGEDPNAEPTYMSVARGGGMDLRKKVREIGVAPLSTNRLAEAGPEKLCRMAREEDVVSILRGAAQRAEPISGSVALEDFDTGGEAATNPLPKEDPNLQR